MRSIVNATFLINTIKSDFDILTYIKLHTIQIVVQEANTELGIEIGSEINIELIPIRTEKQRLNIPKQKLTQLSSTDRKLLQTAFDHRRNSILITDDKQIRSLAKGFKIRCYTTPVFIAFLMKTGTIQKNEGIQFLNKLKEIYIRPKDIEKVLSRIIKWKGAEHK